MRVARTLLVLTLLAEPVLAQTLLVGVRAGQARPRIAWSSTRVSPTREPAVTTGLSATLDVRRWIALEADLLVVEKGMRQVAESPETILQPARPPDELRINYVEMPVLLRLASPWSVLGVQPFLNGGAAPAYEISCLSHLAEAPLGGGRIGPLTSRDCTFWRQTKWDFALAGGGGLLLRRPAYQISISSRRTYGVRDLRTRMNDATAFNETRAFLVGFAARVK